MSTKGDQDDLVARLRSVLPPSWFPSNAPNVTSVLTGPANVGAWLYGLISFAKLQTRLATVGGAFLDLFALDYLARTIRRRFREKDDAFRARVRRAILQERVTRAGMRSALTAVVGAPPTIIEPWNAGDTGALGGFGLALCGNMRAIENGGGLIGAGYSNGMALTLGYGGLYQPPRPGWSADGAGVVGSYTMPAQVFVKTSPIPLAAAPVVAGLNSNFMGLGSGYDATIGAGLGSDAVSVDDIYREINVTRPVGVVVWTEIQGAAALPKQN